MRPDEAVARLCALEHAAWHRCRLGCGEQSRQPATPSKLQSKLAQGAATDLGAEQSEHALGPTRA